MQYVIRPQKHAYRDYRGYAGRIEGGAFKTGDKVKVLPSGFTTSINSVELNGKLPRGSLLSYVCYLNFKG